MLQVQGPGTVADVTQRIGPHVTRGAVRNHLEGLVRDGQAQRAGGGGFDSPLRYSASTPMVTTTSAPTSAPEEGQIVMQETEVMQLAADHLVTAEEAISNGDSGARLHVETAKLLVAMARETRIGNRRSNTYRDVVLKQVHVVPRQALEVGTGDPEDEPGADEPEPVRDERAGDQAPVWPPRT